MKVFLLLICLLYSSSTYAGKWTRKDTIRQVVFISILAVDWQQTHKIATNPRYIETNPILGPNPSIKEIDIYFFSSAVLHSVIAYKLTPKWRKRWQYIWIGIEAGYIHHNYSAGIRLDL